MITMCYLQTKNSSAGNIFFSLLNIKMLLGQDFSVLKIASVLFCATVIIGKELRSFISFLACRLEILFLL